MAYFAKAQGLNVLVDGVCRMASLKEYRLQARLSIGELARRAGVDQGTVNRAESGHPVQEIKAAAIAQVISQALNQRLSIHDLGIVLYS